jgi:hypothetical protein
MKIQIANGAAIRRKRGTGVRRFDFFILHFSFYIRISDARRRRKRSTNSTRRRAAG